MRLIKKTRRSLDPLPRQTDGTAERGGGERLGVSITRSTMVAARLLLGAGLATVARAETLNFLVMADWGGQPTAPYTTSGEISTAGGMGRIAETMNASFALAVGDNFYSSGIATDVDDPRFKHTFEDVFTASSLQGPRFPFYVIAGNHDHGGNVTAQVRNCAESQCRCVCLLLSHRDVRVPIRSRTVASRRAGSTRSLGTPSPRTSARVLRSRS